MFESVERGWAMAKASWAVLKDQPSLAVFPAISAVAAAGLTAALAVPALLGAAAANSAGLSRNTMDALGYAALFVWYFVCAFAVIFCNAALIACALQRFAGQPTSVGSGFAAASRRMPQIFGWALLSSTVGVLLQAVNTLLRDKIGFLGAIVGGIAEGVWGVATYFVVPVLVQEGLGPVAAIKRSSSVLRKTWGESLTGSAGLGILSFVFLLPVVIVGALLMISGAPSAVFATLVAACVAYTLALTVVFTTLGSIFRAGVYRYATTGDAPTHIDASLIQSTFHASR